MKRGRIHMTPEMLVSILDLSPDHRIAVCNFNDHSDRLIEIVVEGPQMPEAGDGQPPLVMPTYRRKDYSLERLDP